MCSYKDEKVDTEERIAIVLTPYFDAKLPYTTYSSLSSLVEDSKVQMMATKNLIDICINMLETGVASSDLQYLVNSDTGEVLIIDLTEAVQIFISTSSSNSNVLIKSSEEKNMEYNRLLTINFLSELRSNIPSNINLENYLDWKINEKLKSIPFYDFLFENN